MGICGIKVHQEQHEFYLFHAIALVRSVHLEGAHSLVQL